MKALIISCLALAAFFSFSACTTVEERHAPTVHSTTTTTEESTIHHPVEATTETRTTRSY
jgi:outer membrane protein assembly factor BamE (lipoprotein component of BamABCDE complex)